MPGSSPDQQLNDWLTAFSDATSQRGISAVIGLFVPGALWRDLAAFTSSIITVEGQDAISDMLKARHAGLQTPLYRGPAILGAGFHG